MDRIERDELNLRIAQLVAQRSTCTRKRVGCVVTVEGRIVVTGYAGSPAKLHHCIDPGIGCSVGADGGCERTVHAEAAAVSFAARKGIALEGGTLYCTLAPCRGCAKLLLNAGIVRVVYGEEYRSPHGLNLLDHGGVKCRHLELT